MMLKRILVLDDNKDVLFVIKEALSYEKYEVRITSDSSHIIKIIHDFKPDLVILDYKLKGFNGDEICRQIKADQLLYDTPVIICSAYLDNNIDLLTCGCDAIIAKPFGLDELLEKVNGLIFA
jgi:DNA-binding response OmpR family regulator